MIEIGIATEIAIEIAIEAVIETEIEEEEEGPKEIVPRLPWNGPRVRRCCLPLTARLPRAALLSRLPVEWAEWPLRLSKLIPLLRWLSVVDLPARRLVSPFLLRWAVREELASLAALLRNNSR